MKPDTGHDAPYWILQADQPPGVTFLPQNSIILLLVFNHIVKQIDRNDSTCFTEAMNAAWTGREEK